MTIIFVIWPINPPRKKFGDVAGHVAGHWLAYALVSVMRGWVVAQTLFLSFCRLCNVLYYLRYVKGSHQVEVLVVYLKEHGVELNLMQNLQLWTRTKISVRIHLHL
jgi:hypothetical protein